MFLVTNTTLYRSAILQQVHYSPLKSDELLGFYPYSFGVVASSVRLSHVLFAQKSYRNDGWTLDYCYRQQLSLARPWRRWGDFRASGDYAKTRPLVLIIRIRHYNNISIMSPPTARVDAIVARQTCADLHFTDYNYIIIATWNFADQTFFVRPTTPYASPANVRSGDWYSSCTSRY